VAFHKDTVLETKRSVAAKRLRYPESMSHLVLLFYWNQSLGFVADAFNRRRRFIDPDRGSWPERMKLAVLRHESDFMVPA
jgi:hypothetical protein